MSNLPLRLIAICVLILPLAAQDTAKQDTAKQDTAKQDAAKQDAAKQDAAKQDAAKQDAAKQGAAKRPPAPMPTNLKVLKVNSGAEITQIMRTFTAALGVQCTFCHVAGNYASDENPKKEMARKMIRMTQQINSNFPDNKMYVSCYTCHRGDAQPKTAPEPKAGG